MKNNNFQNRCNMKPAFRICLFFFVGYFGILYSSLCQVLSEDEKAIQDQAIQHFEKTPVDYNSLLDQALDFQVKADSTRRLTDEKRERLENISGEEKRSKTEEEILELEKQAFEFQKLADEKYTLVREIEQKRLASQILTKKKEQSDKEQEGKETTPGSGFVSDEAGMDVMNQIIDDFYLTEDNRSGKARFERERRPEIQEFKYEFTILKTSAYSASNPIPVNVTLPERVVYRIQLAVFKNPIPPDYFKGLSPVLAEIIPESCLTRYYTGTFRKFVDARAALPAVQNLGFQDGFIVAHFMGKKISLNRARNLESADDSFNKDQKTHPDSVENKSRETGRMTHNLIIKVEVGAYKDQVSEEKMDSFRKMARDKKVEFYLNKNGFYVYTIGIFFTFDKAEKFKDLLIVNGFRDAAVAAFIGKSKIPVEEAKKLSGM